MNRKQFILVLAALAIIGGAGLILLGRNKESWSVREAKMGDKVLPNFRFNDVVAIHIKNSSDLNVVRTNGLWIVRERGGYPASYSQVRNFLIKIRDLKVVQSEAIGASQLANVELEQPEKKTGGTLLEFKDAQGKVIESLLVGKRHSRQQSESTPFNLKSAFDGRYILLPGDPKNVLLISDELASVTSQPEVWLSRDFFKVENIKSISQTVTNAAHSWKVSRENESSPWNLADGKPGETLDTNAVSRAVDTLGFPSFEDVVSRIVPSETALDTTMVIETFDHFTYTLKIGRNGSGENYFLTIAVAAADISAKPIIGKSEKEKSNDKSQGEIKNLPDKLAKEQALSPWVYLIGSHIAEPLICDRAQILEAKKIAGEQTQ